MNEREAKLRELLNWWRKMAEPGSYAIAAGLDLNVGRAGVIASTSAYKTCADQLEKILNEE